MIIPVPNDLKTSIPKILPLWPSQLEDAVTLLATLEKALAEERRRGREGHWAYDLARHAALVRAWRKLRDHVASQ